MSRGKTIVLSVAILIASAFLVVAEKHTTIDVAAAAPEVVPQGAYVSPKPLNAAVGGMNGVTEAAFGPEMLEENPYNNIDGVPTFGARVSSR